MLYHAANAIRTYSQDNPKEKITTGEAECQTQTRGTPSEGTPNDGKTRSFPLQATDTLLAPSCAPLNREARCAYDDNVRVESCKDTWRSTAM